MNLKIINIFTLILSLIIAVIAFWTFKKYSYSLLVENSFKNYVDISNSDITTFIGKNIILRAKIKDEQFFISKKNGDKVVLEYFLVEENKNSRTKKISDLSYLRYIPFKINFNNINIIVEPYELDLTYIGNIIEKKEYKKDNKLISEKYWKFKSNDIIYIFGKLENKAGILSIVNPNIEKSFFEKIFNLSPFIISNYEINEIIQKAIYTKNSMLSITSLLSITSIFFIILSIKKLLDKSV
ncbi:MAG: hypothetical protein KatS3mg068_0878 [Candidatus Sericytochromatia bacterium]|nr:MAG: hypothetical protein KatS3mg068_0878 [Candidatus Sericytochromatia bacterium]